MSDMGDVSRILDINFTRDREKGASTISQKDYTKDVVQHYGMEGCNSTYTSEIGSELSLNQPKEKLLNEEGKQRYQAITGVVIYLVQVTRYDSLYSINQLARPVAKPAKAHKGANKHLVRYLAGSTDFSIIYEQGGFRLAAFSNDNWGNNPDNHRSTPSYIVMLANAPISFKYSRKAYRAEVFFRAKSGGEGQDQHPLRQDRGLPGGLGHQAPYQGSSPRPHQAHQRV